MGLFGKLFGKSDKEGAMGGGMRTAPPASGAKTAKDPVCGMDVDMARPAATSLHQGQTYYFCAPGCKRAFDQDPEKYLKAKS